MNIQPTSSGATSRCASPPPHRERDSDLSQAVTSIRSDTRAYEAVVFSRACRNPHLVKMINLLPSNNNQDTRFSALGMGITAVANFRDATKSRPDVSTWCNHVLDNHPRDPAYQNEISRDPAMKMRGAELVDFMSCGKNDGLVDTLYAQNIAIGKSVQDCFVSDPGFNSLTQGANAFLDFVKASSSEVPQSNVPHSAASIVN
ncbi:hypothetical protein [Burkholderia pyrrocinia]